MKPSTLESVQIKVHKESLHFSCAHFTIFSKNRRENLHGHNYQVRTVATGTINDNGLCFDYNILKSILAEHCERLDEHILIPTQSPYLQISEETEHYRLTLADKFMLLCKQDVMLIDIRNVTVEELARWFMQQLLEDSRFISMPIQQFTLSIASGPSEHATVTWSNQQ
ncbi:MAG: 6-carboxytetrahydropterin synthase [Gammaproteobacteria bacterium]|nr:6-carboxytetrahydropterin synthase [Gammaproteobacteria bacterium]MDE0252395.1 6-carboxytetrahydropterin synthase [Gammaproteobacteria bacterium]MDE0402496.1 6-carboxytetrahydropterin synthase [Gammaproteobacteria bacterium]